MANFAGEFMYKIILSVFFSCILTGLCWADNTDDVIQVDIVLFQHLAPALDSNESSLTPALPGGRKNRISLQESGFCQSRFYCLLPINHSNLKNSWYALLREPDYQPLAHYSWRQPAADRKFIVLPASQENDLQISGTVRIRELNYYYFNSELILSSGMGQAPMALKQKLRIKEKQTVYIDHPQIGMLVRIQKQAAANT